MDYSPPNTPPENQEPTTFLQKVTWLFKGFVYPIWSRPYYKEAASKSMGTALVFLLVFALLQTIVASISVSLSLSNFNDEIDTAYLSGEIPDITIENGIATVSGVGRYIVENNRQIIAVDTTGTMQEINTNQYSEGFLLTRTDFHLVNEDGYQVIPLSDLNQTFGNPIILNADSVTGLWSKLAVFINVLVLVGGYLWFSIGRFIYLALLGLIVWGAVSISHKNVDFAKILITGIFANVPTTYIIFILRKIGFSFFGLRGLILFVIWGIAIAYILKKETSETLSDDLSTISPP
jgi:hypothetical protein